MTTLCTILALWPIGAIPTLFLIALDHASGGKEAGYLIPRAEHRPAAIATLTTMILALAALAILTGGQMTP